MMVRSIAPAGVCWSMATSIIRIAVGRAQFHWTQINLPIPLDYQDAYFKMNARIGLTTPDERLTFELWGTNLNNEKTRGITANTPLRGGAGTRSRIGFVEEPRMYGLTVRGKF